MCTLTCLRRPRGNGLLFNRGELRTRAFESTATFGGVTATDEVAFVYEAGPPCSAATATPLALGGASRTEGTAP